MHLGKFESILQDSLKILNLSCKNLARFLIDLARFTRGFQVRFFLACRNEDAENDSGSDQLADILLENFLKSALDVITKISSDVKSYKLPTRSEMSFLMGKIRISWIAPAHYFLKFHTSTSR